jgi:stage V sporulation protein G
MKITEVRIFSSESRDGKLKAFATMTFDDWFVVRNVKIIQGTNGLFVAMPSRKVMDTCPKCGFKNARGSKYCNQCGKEQARKDFAQEDDTGEKQAGHMDIAHPVTPECRTYIQQQILDAYEKEREARKGNREQAPEQEKCEPTPEKRPEEGSIDTNGAPREGLVLDREQDIEL